MGDLNRAAFYWINQWPESLRPFFVFCSEGIKWRGVQFVLAAFVAAMLAFRSTRAAVIQALIAWPLSDGLCNLLKNGFKWNRPCVDLADAILRVGKLTTFGTASAHAANMAAIATVLTFRLGWKASPWIGVALLVGLSRIYVGVHYPGQVLFGWLVGIGIGFLVLWASDLIVNRVSTVRKADDRTSEPT